MIKHKKTIFALLLKVLKNRIMYLNLKKNNIRNNIISKEAYYKSLKNINLLYHQKVINSTLAYVNQNECLMCGCIPIIQKVKKSLIHTIVVLILYTKDYSEITCTFDKV